jgi:peroxiredoxin
MIKSDRTMIRWLKTRVVEVTMLKSIRSMKAHRAWQQKYEKHAPKVGDLAPDFELYDTRNEGSVRLSDFRGEKPVALIFGSYT